MSFALALICLKVILQIILNCHIIACHISLLDTNQLVFSLVSKCFFCHWLFSIIVVRINSNNRNKVPSSTCSSDDITRTKPYSTCKLDLTGTSCVV